MIFLTLFCIFATVKSVSSPEIHNLHYIYTALSKPISQPGVYQFTAMGILDDRQIDFCNSTNKVKMPMQKWMEEHNEADYSTMEKWFKFSIRILMEHMRQNKPDPDVHILQWMHGCQVEKTTDGKVKFLKGFDQYGYDGDDFLSFDIQRTEWVVHANAAESTKKEWDESFFTWYTMEYLQMDCVHWLEKLLKYQEQDFQTFYGKCRNCDSDNTGAIVGGVVGVVLLIVLVTVSVVLYILRRRNNGVRTEENGSNSSVQSGDSGRGSPTCGGPEEVHLVTNAEGAAQL